MLIQLTDSDLSKMPTALHCELLEWLRSMNSDDLNLKDDINLGLDERNKRTRSQIHLSQLFDSGLTRSGMPVRIRLTRDQAREIGRNYINSMTITPRGTVIYEGEEFGKASPLASKVNSSSVNGWEYLEVKRDGEWVKLDILRQQIR